MIEKTDSKKPTDKKSTVEIYVQIAIIGLLTLVIVFNLGKIYGLGGNIFGGEIIQRVSASEIVPLGVPEIYGKEIGVSYDDISPDNPRLADETINKLSQYENMELNSKELERYIKIAGSISCEYCCGAESIIFPNGERACGCAHSYAMRGLAKYLIRNHPEMTDLEILSELGKWKVLFFPGIHDNKALVLEQNGIDSNDYINLASNKYRGIEYQQQSSSGNGAMVGGC